MQTSKQHGGTNVNKRFADVSAEEIDDIVDRKDSKSTKKCVTSSATLFNEFLRESGVSCDINQCSEATLDEHLRKFYASVRTKKGDLFKTSTFQYLRYGLSRYIKSKTGIDVCQNECFNSSREVYRAVLVDMKKKRLWNY